MNNKQTEFEKIIAEADKAIAAAEAAKAKKRDAENKLRKQEQKSHQKRIEAIGRSVYAVGLDHLEGELIVGILIRGMEAIEKDDAVATQLRTKGKSALSAAYAAAPLQVLLPDRPNRSISAILREAGLRKDTAFKPEGEHECRYIGKANKGYLERRLTGTGAVIQSKEKAKD